MMSNNLLEVKDLSVNVEEQQILRGINLNIGKGETHVLMGPNGAGKSTLGYTIMVILSTALQTARLYLTERI